MQCSSYYLLASKHHSMQTKISIFITSKFKTKRLTWSSKQAKRIKTPKAPDMSKSM